MTVWEVRELLREPSDWHLEGDWCVHYSGCQFPIGDHAIILWRHPDCWNGDIQNWKAWDSNLLTWLLVRNLAKRVERACQ